MKIEVMTITPKIAEKWLEKNVPNNRSKKRANISQMKHDMENGTFYVTTDCIGFDSHNNLINGQNRLTACVESGRSFKQAVMFDIDPAAMLVMDSGAKRTSNDHFRIAGRAYPSNCGGTVRRMFLGFRSHHVSFSDMEVDKFMQMRRNREAIWFAHRVFLLHHRFSSLRAVTARAHILSTIHKHGWENALEKFAYVINTGNVTGVYELSASALRTWILDHSRQSHGGEWSKVELYSMVQSALHSFLNRERHKQLLPAEHELFKLPGEDKWYEPESLPVRNGRVMQPA